MPNEDKVEIIGTPTAAGAFDFTLEVTCYVTQVSGQVGDQVYQVIVR